jgi:hypothetical protein
MSHPELRPPHLPTQRREFVPELEQLHIVHIRTMPATNQETERARTARYSNEKHIPRSSQPPAQNRRDASNGALHAVRG